jgi:uncharacterized delta-60 repeat protein
MIKIFLIIFTLISFCTVDAFSQVVEEWVARYNGLGNGGDTPRTIAVDDSSNVYVSGDSYGIGSNFDYAAVKYNSEGNELWVARYNGPGNHEDRPFSMTIDDFGNVYLTGTSLGSGTSYDYATVKYSSSGAEQWVARYDGPNSEQDRANTIAVDGSGNVYVTGYSFGDSTDLDYATVKYNSSGTQAWEARYNGPADTVDAGNSIAVDDSGNVFVTGYSIGLDGNYDFATIKYNSIGQQQWVKRYNGPANRSDRASSMAIDNSSNVYVTGTSYGDTTDADWATIKYNSDGVVQWIAIYNGSLNSLDSPNKIIIDDLCNVYVTGSGSYNSGDGEDFTTIKYNSSGEEQWISTFNGQNTFRDVSNSIALDGMDNVYITGRTWVTQLDYDFATIKYNASGQEQWVAIYNGPADGDDWASSIATDVSGNAYVTGWSEGVGSGYDFATIKYSSTTGVKTYLDEFPSNYVLRQNYPNPFNPITKIKFQIPDFGFVTLKVYDVLGNEVATLVNEELPVGEYEVEFSSHSGSSGISAISSGIYFYQLKAGSFIQTKKMVLIK